MSSVSIIDLDSAEKAFDAILPVVKIAFDGQISLIGTTFVVTNTGIVMTAKHVILDNLDVHGKDLGGIGVLPIYGRFAGRYRPFHHSSWHSSADIALCECARFAHRDSGEEILNTVVFDLSLKHQRLGEPVSSQFFHDPALKPDQSIPNEPTNPLRRWVTRSTLRVESAAQGTPDPDDIPRGFSPSARITHGKLTNYFARGRDSVMLPFPVFETNMPIYGGSSGGPVFNSEGHVIAINCTRFEGNDVAYPPVSD